jgi:hypothetical protein
MRLNEFEAMIIPFINVRGWDIVYPPESLSVAIQNWIQTIFNEYKWSWLYTTKKINKEDWIDSNWYYTYDLWNIKSIETVEYRDASSYIDYEQVTRITDLWDNKFLRFWNYVIVSEPKDLSISYYDDFTWDLFPTDKSKEVPLPSKFIPALYYLVLSQIDIIEVTQAEWETYTNYWKYTNQITKLKDNDPIPVTKLEWGGRY